MTTKRVDYLFPDGKGSYDQVKFTTDGDLVNANGYSKPTNPATINSSDDMQTMIEKLDRWTDCLPVLMRNKAYSVGDIGITNKLASNLCLECVTAGTTGAAEPSLSSVSVGDNVQDCTVKWIVRKNVSDTTYTHPTTSGNKHIPSGGSSGQILRWSADGTAVWGADNNTTYSSATTVAAGLMSASDKIKLDGIASGAQVNTVTGVKGNSESSYRSGNVNITKANIGLGNVDNTADANKSVSYADNAGTVNGLMVQTAVPANAKFTDTTYSAMSASEATTGTATTARTITAKVLADYVAACIATLVNSAPAALDTLNELAAALGNDPNFATTMATALGNKLGKTETAVNAEKVNNLTVETAVPANAKFTDTTYSTFVKSGSTAAAGLVPKPSTTAGTTKYLREDGTWQVPPDNNTTYSNFVKSGSNAAAGLVPAPSTTAGTTKYLREDGTWQVPPDNNTVYTHPTTSGNKHIPSGGSSGQFLGWDSDGTAKWVANPNTNTDTLMTQNVSTTNSTYPVLLCPTANATANQGAKTGLFGSGVKVNPSTSEVIATKFTGALTGNVTGNCSGSSGSCTGNAATATKATGDKNGEDITSTYLKLSGGTMTGALLLPSHSKIFNQSYDWANESTPTSTRFTSLMFSDKNEKAQGYVEVAHSYTGTKTIQLVLATDHTNPILNTMGLRYNGSDFYGFAPTPPDTADNTDKIATTAWVRTATGNTTLNAATATKLGSYWHESLVKGTNPSTITWPRSSIVFDKNGARINEWRSFVDSNGTVGNELLSYDFAAGASNPATLGVYREKGGAGYATCPSPAVADNSTKIATTAWVRTATGNTSLNAATATKATGDKNGADITTTYATKAEVAASYATQADVDYLATTATNSVSAAVSAKNDAVTAKNQAQNIANGLASIRDTAVDTSLAISGQAADSKTVGDKFDIIGASEATNDEYMWVLLDSQQRVLLGVKADGSVAWQKGVPKPIRDELDAIKARLDALES